MTDDELYESAKLAYGTKNYRRWMADQPDDTLFRLYNGLAAYREGTLVVRTQADLAQAETHEGPVVLRDYEPRDWFDYCDDMCLLDEVTDVLGQRLYAALQSDDRETILRADLPDARRVLSDWLRVVEDRVCQPGGPPGVEITYACESRFIHTHGMGSHGLPELGIRDVPLFLRGPASEFLSEVSAQVLARPGDVRLGEIMAVSKGIQFRFVPADPPGRDEYRRAETWRLADVGESYLACDQPECVCG